MEQNFELSERKVDIQDKRIADIIIYQLDAIKEHYDENLELINKQFPIATQLIQQGCNIKPRDQMKQKLDELYHRRNRIAHQTDRSERDAVRQAISDKQVEKYIDDINKIVVAIMKEMQTF